MRTSSFLLISTVISLVGAPYTVWGQTSFSNPKHVAPSTPSRIAEWEALTGPGGASYPAARYAQFLQLSPEWPLQKRIEWRYQHALLSEQNPQTLRALCPSIPFTQLDALIHCAPYLRDAEIQARRLWRDSITTQQDEQTLLAQFGPSLHQEDDTARYKRLEASGPYSSAQRQLERMPASGHDLLAARLANHFATNDADSYFNAVSQTYDAGLIYYRLRYLRSHNRAEDAVLLWQQIPSPALTRIWASPFHTQDELTELARTLLRANAPDAAQQSLQILRSIPTSSQTTESHFLTGYIALTYFQDSIEANLHFKPLTDETNLNDRAAGFYWLARTAEVTAPQKTTVLFAQAASFPTTFYGQLAIAHITHTAFLSSSIRETPFLLALKKELSRLPTLPAQTAPLPRPDLINAIHTLYEENDLINATLFLTYLQAHTSNDAISQANIARLALKLHLPKAAILAARYLAQRGIPLYPEGYPTLDDLPPFNSTLPNGLLPALMRQESSMDRFAVSPRHAFGLTQLLLPTAQHIIHRHHMPFRVNSPLSLFDPNLNSLVGSAYLQDISVRFGDVLPYSLAAYNAGPARVQQWQNIIESPTTPSLKDEDILLRWILLIPFKETRSYIEHIEANMSLYVLLSH